MITIEVRHPHLHNDHKKLIRIVANFRNNILRLFCREWCLITGTIALFYVDFGELMHYFDYNRVLSGIYRGNIGEHIVSHQCRWQFEKR
jgi:hypothetical protein